MCMQERLSSGAWRSTVSGAFHTFSTRRFLERVKPVTRAPRASRTKPVMRPSLRAMRSLYLSLRSGRPA